ncbi:MAG TPA: lysophospholipid acyltransferase family protein [Candidatus Ozemobacteraceae bacterium]|nr:lysophospholipid acyltransferase family protein [Candidatus Ozemobacteraceae bacterium]
MIHRLGLTLSRLACHLPDTVGRRLAVGLGWTAAALLLHERRNLQETIDRVYTRVGRPLPMPLSEIVNRVFPHFALNLYEILRYPLVTRDLLVRRFHVHGREHFETALQRGKGVILVVPHLGNWETLGEYLAHYGYPLHSFYLAQKEDHLGSLLDHFRTYSRIVLHDRDRGLVSALRTLKRGEVLGMISDQDGGNYGVYLDFLGHWVSLPAGPANWSLRTGASVVRLYCLRRGLSADFDAWFLPALPAVEGTDHEACVQVRTKHMADWMQEIILRYPHQYLWFYHRFKPRHEAQMSRLKQSGHRMRTGMTAYGIPPS